MGRVVSTARPSMRCSGDLYFKYRELNIDSSSTNILSIFSPFSSPFVFVYMPCSFNDSPKRSAYPRITVLNALLPVKYNMANGNSSGEVYIKSTRRACSTFGNLAITRHFVFPLERTSIITFLRFKSSTNSTNTLAFFDVIITSISPDVFAPRL